MWKILDLLDGLRNCGSSRLPLLFITLGVCLTLAACQKTVSGQTKPQVTLSPGESHVERIFPTQQWQDTGVIVRRGQTYRITASGNWSFGAICGIADANGVGNTPICNAGDGSVPGASNAALVGRIGSGRAFLVGTLSELKAEADGTLFLGTNAWDWLPEDNSGFLRVAIRLQTAAPASPRPRIQQQVARPSPAPTLAPPPILAQQPTVGGPRIALVVGNSAYRDAPLANPVNDANLMARTLSAVGFEVIHRTDVSQKEMKRALNMFGDRLETAGREAVGLFYYAGHGIQVGGRNYLIPVDADIQREKDVDVEGVAADTVLSAMEYAGNRLNFAILDACRNNPYKRSFRSSVRGLARMDAPRGTLIAYATGPGDVAVDGSGRNSPYTAALAESIKQERVSVERMFRMVRNAVMAATDSRQVPWEASSLTGGDYYFNPGR
jgi:hypothetical protein